MKAAVLEREWTTHNRAIHRARDEHLTGSGARPRARRYERPCRPHPLQPTRTRPCVRRHGPRSRARVPRRRWPKRNAELATGARRRSPKAVSHGLDLPTTEAGELGTYPCIVIGRQIAPAPIAKLGGPRMASTMSVLNVTVSKPAQSTTRARPAGTLQSPRRSRRCHPPKEAIDSFQLDIDARPLCALPSRASDADPCLIAGPVHIRSVGPALHWVKCFPMSRPAAALNKMRAWLGLAAATSRRARTDSSKPDLRHRRRHHARKPRARQARPRPRPSVRSTEHDPRSLSSPSHSREPMMYGRSTRT